MELNPQAKTWRARAGELRVMADGFSDATARADPVRLAVKWEKMAECAQTQSGGSKPAKDGDGRG